LLLSETKASIGKAVESEAKTSGGVVSKQKSKVRFLLLRGITVIFEY